MGSIYKRGDVWWIKYYRNGRAIRESTSSDKEKEAKRLLQLREGDVARGVPVTPKMGRVRFQELAEDLVTEYRVNGRRSLRDLEMRLKRHILPVFGHQRAGSITTADLNRFIANRQASHAANAEINRELAAIKRAFVLGIRGGKLLVRPYIPMLKENNVRKGFFEREEFERVRKHLPEDLKGMVTFAYITGWRIPSEVLKLQWRQVDFQAGVVRLDPGTTKNNEGREFPFTRELRELLVRQKEKRDALLREKQVICPYVFHRGGRPIRYFRRSWISACEKAALPGRIPHDFRRTAVRNLVRAGVPERVAMMMTGHKTRSVFERYNIVSPGDLLDAARRLDEASDRATGLKELPTPITAP